MILIFKLICFTSPERTFLKFLLMNWIIYLIPKTFGFGLILIYKLFRIILNEWNMFFFQDKNKFFILNFNNITFFFFRDLENTYVYFFTRPCLKHVKKSSCCVRHHPARAFMMPWRRHSAVSYFSWKALRNEIWFASLSSSSNKIHE